MAIGIACRRLAPNRVASGLAILLLGPVGPPRRDGRLRPVRARTGRRHAVGSYRLHRHFQGRVKRRLSARELTKAYGSSSCSASPLRRCSRTSEPSCRRPCFLPASSAGSRTPDDLGRRRLARAIRMAVSESRQLSRRRNFRRHFHQSQGPLHQLTTCTIMLLGEPGFASRLRASDSAQRLVFRSRLNRPRAAIGSNISSGLSGSRTSLSASHFSTSSRSGTW